eukprot:3377849-Rhodomonas_salina.1
MLPHSVQYSPTQCSTPPLIGPTLPHSLPSTPALPNSATHNPCRISYASTGHRIPPYGMPVVDVAVSA